MHVVAFAAENVPLEHCVRTPATHLNPASHTTCPVRWSSLAVTGVE
jgi:hypothetical protein